MPLRGRGIWNRLRPMININRRSATEKTTDCHVFAYIDFGNPSGKVGRLSGLTPDHRNLRFNTGMVVREIFR